MVDVFRVFQLQGLLVGLLSLPVALACSNAVAGIGAFELAGVVIWLVAIGGESVADMQLALFKAHPAAKGRVCDLGLWKYSRHPNYFSSGVCGLPILFSRPDLRWGG